MNAAATHRKSIKRKFLRAATVVAACALFLQAAPSSRGAGGSIFDDDFIPAKRAEPAPQPPPVAPAPHETAPVTPAKAPPSVVTPSPTPSLAPAAPAIGQARRAIPDHASRAKCRKLFEEIYAKELKDHSPAARRKLAITLMDEAGKTAEGSPDQFVLLYGAIQAAEEAQSLRICFIAAAQLAKEYDVDEAVLKTDAATKLFSASPSAALSSASNIEALFALADQLVDEDAFTTVAQVESILQRASPSIADADLKTDVKNQIREVAAIREVRQKIAPAVEKLRQSPDDAAANLAVGSYLSFLRGQWEKGLPLQAKSSDPQLKNLATDELRHPTGTDELSKLGDGWLGAATKLPSQDHPKVMQHAVEMYHMAEAGVTGLQRLAIEKKLAQIPPPARLRRVDLLESFDPAISTVAGVWRMENGTLVSEVADHARVDFAYQPPEEYDFRVSFTAVKVEQALGPICYGADHQFMCQLAGWGNTLSGLELVDGLTADKNKTATRKDHFLTNGQHYILVVKIRRTGVEAYLDGRLVTSLKTDYSDLTLNSAWTLSHGNSVGLVANVGVIRFDKVEIIEITGQGKLLTP